MRAILFMISFIFFASCGMEDQKVYSKLESLRVLALQADQPEINSATTVNVTPFISYTNGGDTTLNVSYSACLDPGIAFGAKVSCDDPIGGFSLSGSGTVNTSTIGSANFYTGTIPPISLVIPASAFTYLAALDSDTQFNGYDIILIVEISDQADSSEKVTALKRISLTTKSSGLNTNPTISGAMTSDGVTLSSMPSSTSDLIITGLSSAESYDFQSNTGTSSITETQTISWFSNEGDFQFSRTDPDESVEFDPEGAASGVIVGVFRDNRGGVQVIRVVL